MIVENNNTIINLREKFLESQKRKGNLSKAQTESISSNKDVKAERTNLTNIIAIKKENILASTSAIRNENDADKLLNELKDSFYNEPNSALNAHKKADTNRIMGFYPFD